MSEPVQEHRLKRFLPLRLLKALLAVLLAGVALILPYRLRMIYIKQVSFLFHLPFMIIGLLIGFLMRRLNLKPSDIYDYK